MNLQQRLSFYSVTLFSIVMVVATSFIYFSFYKKMEESEMAALENKTLIAAIYYLEDDEVGHVERETIKDQLRKSISRKNIAVFNEKDSLSKGEMSTTADISKGYLEKIREEKEANLVTKSFFYNGLYYEDNEGNFVVITRESKDEFNQQLFTLLQILVIVSISGIVLIYFISYFLGKFAYLPLTKIIEQIKQRDNENFTEPIYSGDAYTEIQDLVHTYNHFINRLANTFNIQKNFIDYVSHELKTPITALMGNLDVTQSKLRTVEEYNKNLSLLKDYVKDLEGTLDNMLLLSGAKTDFEFKTIHVDDIIWEAVEQMFLYHQAQIEVDILVKDPNLLVNIGNKPLLLLALTNLLENAIKYSDNQMVKVVFKEEGHQLEITIEDSGIGIVEDDIKNIKNNFFRGRNTEGYSGKGIGLSMANIIFTLHKISLSIENNKPRGTIVKLLFPIALKNYSSNQTLM